MSSLVVARISNVWQPKVPRISFINSSLEAHTKHWGNGGFMQVTKEEAQMWPSSPVTSILSFQKNYAEVLEGSSSLQPIRWRILTKPRRYAMQIPASLEAAGQALMAAG